MHRPVAGRGGPGVRTPPEPVRVTFPNRVNPVTFFIGGGGGLGWTGGHSLNNAQNDVCVSCLPQRCYHVKGESFSSFMEHFKLVGKLLQIFGFFLLPALAMH